MLKSRTDFFAALCVSLRQPLRNALMAAAAFAAVAIAWAPSANAQEVEIKLITGFPLEGISGDKVYGAKLFIERFNAKAKGRAHIRVIGGPEVVSPFDQLKALQTGQF